MAASDEFILHSKNVVMPDGVREAYVWIKDGIISGVSSESPDNAFPIIGLEEKVLMSGVIDPHVHINEPGRTDWEGFDTATKAAIAGGITTLVDMPLNSTPVTTTVSAFQQKMAATKNQLHTNCGFWSGIVPGNEKEIEPLIEKGILGFKAFLTHSGIDDFPNVLEADLRKVMPTIAKHRLPLLVHCELADDRSLKTDNARSYQNYLASRPKDWEDKAIALMIRLCEEFDCPVHIVHLSSANSIETIMRGKENGLPLTVETAQHYLFFCSEEIPDGATAFKCAPPVREKENNEQLWQALKEGIIDFVATDHSPSIPKLKELENGDFTRAWGGIASLQFALPVLWTAARQRGFSIKDVSKWLSKNPAKLIQKENKIGQIAKGFDADLIVWNPDEKFIVSKEIIYHKHKTTPYIGKELAGVVEQTFLSGIKVYDKGHMLLNKGQVLLH